MNKWQMEGRAMPDHWKGREFDIPPAGQKSHMQLSIHPKLQQNVTFGRGR